MSSPLSTLKSTGSCLERGGKFMVRESHLRRAILSGKQSLPPSGLCWRRHHRLGSKMACLVLLIEKWKSSSLKSLSSELFLGNVTRLSTPWLTPGMEGRSPQALGWLQAGLSPGVFDLLFCPLSTSIIQMLTLRPSVPSCPGS